MVERTWEALNKLPEARLIFTAHSIPTSFANTSRYVEQLQEACRLVAGELGRTEWRLVYQSRSGSPMQPWLGLDIGDYLQEIGAGADVVIVPI